MNRQVVAMTGGALALAASLGLNGYLLAQDPPKPPRPPVCEPAPAPAPAPAAIAPPRDTGDANEACKAELAKCNEARWGMALRAIAGAPAASAAPAAPPSDAGPLLPADAAQQAEALTQMSRDLLRAYLRMSRDVTLPVLVNELRDPARVAALTKVDGEALAKSAGVSGPERARMEHEYATMRTARIAAAREAFDRNPPDYAAVVDVTKKLFADEDALVAKYSGDAARERWRSLSIKKRTALVATLASFGDQPWDGSLAW